ncbi:MAG: LysE family transporter [Alphaproteobacteria bacterium]|jgi:RhtB (resistance to homoserine/threonine) family protein|nr:LysE family transporter [Alphaproteobacteria bacterium]
MLIDYLPSILALTGIQLVGLISPGPDFAVVVRNSLVYSRKTGLITAVGVAFGTLIHLAYILLGLGIVISKTVLLFHLVKYLGASYLIYIGIKGLMARKRTLTYGNLSHHKDISSLEAFQTGVLTNAINVKCMLFFLSVISAFITPNEPGMIIFIYGMIIFFTTLIWFLIVAVCFSHKHLRQFFSNSRHWIERCTGGLLMLLGIRILFIEVVN